jgi:hypothetical protein
VHKEYAIEWLTLDFDSSCGEIIQDEEDWIDLEDFKSFAFTLVMPIKKNVDAILETARTREGPWTEVANMDAPTAAEGYAAQGIVGVGTDVAADSRFDRFTRLRLKPTDTGRFCFRMTGIMKA